MLAENSFHEDDMANRDSGIFIVERLASEEPLDSSNSSGSYEACEVRIENLTDEFTESQITVQLQPGLRKEDSTHDLFEVTNGNSIPAHISLMADKSGVALSSIRNNLHFLNLND